MKDGDESSQELPKILPIESAIPEDTCLASATLPNTGSLDNQRLRNILAACPIGLCHVEDRKFRWVNHALVKMFGYDSERDFIGQDARMIYPSAEEYRSAGAALYMGSNGGTESEVDTKLMRKDGSTIHAHIRISAPDATDLTKGTIAAITDRSAVIEAQAAIIESERRFREILENVRLVSVSVDMLGNITFCNDFLLETTGWEREEVLGRNWFVTFSPEGEDCPRGSQHRGALAPSHHGETDIVTRTGELRRIRWNTTIFLRNSLREVIGLASIGEDITDRQRANTLLLRTERIKAVGEMASAVAHNFNNLMQIVMGSTQTALACLRSTTNSRIEHDLLQILKACELGAETVKRLQQFAKVGTHDPTYQAVFDLSETVRQAVEMTIPWWKTNPERDGIKISLAMDLDHPCLVNGKENELFEVMVNLIKNAAEALPKGGNIRTRTIRKGIEVLFQIEDDGVGIPGEHLGRVFQPFWSTKGFQGTGMGLSSSYAIITRHGGDIFVESLEGKGTTFTVMLPLAKGRVVLPSTAPMKFPDPPLRLLVVDDMDMLLATLRDGLIAFGHQVLTASSGDEALSLFQENPVDAVICDLGMKGLNGLEVGRAMQEICSRKGVPQTPFILLTGWGNQITEQERSGLFAINRVVAKPVSITELLEVLRDIVRENEASLEARGTNG